MFLIKSVLIKRELGNLLRRHNWPNTGGLVRCQKAQIPNHRIRTTLPNRFTFKKVCYLIIICYLIYFTHPMTFVLFVNPFFNIYSQFFLLWHRKKYLKENWWISNRTFVSIDSPYKLDGYHIAFSIPIAVWLHQSLSYIYFDVIRQPVLLNN